MGDTRVGIGMIGTGFSRRVQIPAFLACKDAFVASVASGAIENARETASEFAIEHATADWRETASHPDVDLVCITTPPNLHLEMALFAIEHGKHVVCEKPMAMSAAEAEQMTMAAEGKPTLALIDHELRFQPGRLRAYKMLRDGEIGKIRHAKWIFQAPHRGDPGLPWNWWSDKNTGGGALGAIGSHVVDGFEWLLGTGISSVFCQLHSHIKERRDSSGIMRKVTSDDEANMLLRFEDNDLTVDATGLASISMTEGPSYRNELFLYGIDGEMRLGHRGELAIARLSDTDWTIIDVDLGDDAANVADTGFSRAFTAFARVLTDAIHSGSPNIPHAATFADGLRTQKVLDAAHISHDTGGVQKI